MNVALLEHTVETDRPLVAVECPRCGNAFTHWCNYHQVSYCDCAAKYHANCP